MAEFFTVIPQVKPASIRDELSLICYFYNIFDSGASAGLEHHS